MVHHQYTVEIEGDTDKLLVEGQDKVDFSIKGVAGGRSNDIEKEYASSIDGDTIVAKLGSV